VTLNANAFAGGGWTGGAGTFNPNRNTANATYIPAASEIGSIVSLTWNLPDPDGAGACAATSDILTITLGVPPAANILRAKIAAGCLGSHRAQLPSVLGAGASASASIPLRMARRERRVQARRAFYISWMVSAARVTATNNRGERSSGRARYRARIIINGVRTSRDLPSRNLIGLSSRSANGELTSTETRVSRVGPRSLAAFQNARKPSASSDCP
jgi:hypothetical protein